jgi:hypothetical protein
MKVKKTVEITQRAIETPVQTWLDYTPKGTPIVVFDNDEFVFINHPNPPTERPEQLSAANGKGEIALCCHA